MRIAHGLLALVCAAAPVATPFAIAFAQDAETETPLQAAMHELQNGQRGLRKLIEQPDQKEAALALVRNMQTAAWTAFGHPPEQPDDSDVDATAWRVGFRRKLLELLDQTLVLELALHEGRVDDAKASYAALTRVKNEGHERFQGEEE